MEIYEFSQYLRSLHILSVYYYLTIQAPNVNITNKNHNYSFMVK